jgi:hypothetical protein
MRPSIWGEILVTNRCSPSRFQVAITVFVVVALSAFHGRLLANDDTPPQDQESEQQILTIDDLRKLEEYILEQRHFGTNMDPVTRLNNSLPKTDSLLDWTFPEGLARFKKNLNKKHHLKLGVSYQSLYQKASASMTDKDSAWGGWFLFQGSWKALNPGRDWQGKLVFAIDARHTINPSTNASPGLFNFDIGSLWATDGAYFDWRLYPAMIFWEQWGSKDRFAFRVGQLAGLSVLDPFRFDEPRSSFTVSTAAAPVSIIPVGPPGLGIAAKWWPVRESELYVRAIVNDINAPAGKVDWSGLFEYGDVFDGAEIGYYWIRDKEDFDHTHLTLWYADAVSSAPYPSTAGWGFKLAGSKQWGQIVGFANYAYNNAEGGGFGVTNSRQAVNAGVARMRPLGIRGEVAFVVSWGEPLADISRDQSGLEVYWKILVTPDLWLTPGVQYVANPTFNPEIDRIWIPQIKFSLFF